MWFFFKIIFAKVKCIKITLICNTVEISFVTNITIIKLLYNYNKKFFVIRFGTTFRNTDMAIPKENAWRSQLSYNFIKVTLNIILSTKNLTNSIICNIIILFCTMYSVLCYCIMLSFIWIVWCVYSARILIVVINYIHFYCKVL